MRRRVRLSRHEARRIAMAASGFDRERPSRVDQRHFRRLLETIGLLQLDYVNVLMPAHYLIAWSRLGAYSQKSFHRYFYHSGEATEHWAHEASIVQSRHWSSLAYRRDRYEPYKNSPIRKLPGRKQYLADVLEAVRQDGALTASELPPAKAPRRNPGDWHKSLPRTALEVHFGRGELSVADRLPNFQRVYDLPERVLAADQLSPSRSVEEGHRTLLRQAAQSLGIASLADLADYYRMTAREIEPRVQELCGERELQQVEVEGWDTTAYLHSQARHPRSISGACLLSPFDPVVWFRPRTLRLFDFHYRIEIYVSEAKREYGYYVLPFRLGDDLAARVDLKADRKNGHLLVRASYLEAGAATDEVLPALVAELRALADWQGLTRILVTRHNSFSRALKGMLTNS